MIQLQYLLNVIELIVFTYLTMSTLYVFMFALAGHFYRKREQISEVDLGHFVILIPAYKEDNVIVEVAKSTLLQQYPPSFFDVVVIADSLKPSTLESLKKLQIKVIEVGFENSTKSKALNAALDQLEKNYDHALVLDADNIMEPNFLFNVNKAFNNGYRIVQTNRTAKNLNTSFAILDAASEAINNHIFRRGHRALGLSSGLIGSGMVFEYELFKLLMKRIQAVGGFDKELEFDIADKKITIEYLQDVLLFDEKIQRSKDFSNQRRRWLATQFVYLRRNFLKAWKELLINGNINFFDKMWQLVIPPRLLLIGSTSFLTGLFIVLNYGLHISTLTPVLYWVLLLCVLIVAFILALPGSFYKIHTAKALFSLPIALSRMFVLLFKLKNANKQFIHTTHHN